MTRDEEFHWNTPASRAYLRALMHEQETLLATIAHGDAHFLTENSDRTTLGKLKKIRQERDRIDAAYKAARVDTEKALEELADEMREEIGPRFSLEVWIKDHLTDSERSRDGNNNPIEND